MRIELILIVVAGFVIANIYTDGKYWKLLLSWKKYYQMAGVAFGAFILYWLIKKNPKKANDMIATSNEYLKYLPIDSGATKYLSPILDFTSKTLGGGGAGAAAGVVGASSFYGGSEDMPILSLGGSQASSQAINRLQESGKKATKRSVSETKKKFVAARQNWKCGDCNNQLSAWFEVDHKVRLEYGGSNHIDNLVALCRECHGKKTAMENL
jgi:hypothetical protein